MRHIWSRYDRIPHDMSKSEEPVLFEGVDIVYAEKTERLKDNTLLRAGAILGEKPSQGLETKFVSHSQHVREGGLLIWGRPKAKVILRKKVVNEVAKKAEQAANEQLNKTYIDVRTEW